MNRKKLVRAAAIVLLAAFWLAYFGPHHMLKADNVEYGRCEYYSEEYPNGTYLDLTEEQADALLEILRPLWCHRVWGEDRHFLADVVFEITLYIDDRPFHVVLGRRDWCFESNEILQQFDIIGGDKATSQILELLNIDENQVNINGRREI